MVAVHTPGADQRRAWQAEDHSYLVLTLDQGRIVAMRDFRDRDEAGRSIVVVAPAVTRPPGVMWRGRRSF